MSKHAENKNPQIYSFNLFLNTEKFKLLNATNQPAIELGYMLMTPAKFWIKQYRSSDRLKSHHESLNNPKHIQSIRSTH